MNHQSIPVHSNPTRAPEEPRLNASVHGEPAKSIGGDINLARVRNKETGEITEVFLVDARELVASGSYESVV